MIHSLFIFRRDLRVADNAALLAASAASDRVTACFILDKAILDRYQDHSFRLKFLMDSLADLDRQIMECGGSLRIFRGEAVEVVDELLDARNFDAVYINRDYTPFASRRDQALRQCCNRHGVKLSIHGDALLNEPESVLKKDGTPYVVFTPYHRVAATYSVAAPEYLRPANLAGTDAPGESWQDLAKPDVPIELTVPAGRTAAIGMLKDIGRLADYEETRNLPGVEGTSRLSAHLRFGTCSVREAWHQIAAALGRQHPLLRQLYWRDFFTQVGWHHPHVFGHAFRPEFDQIRWCDDDAVFELWCAGKTGFPIVDAAMHELVATGYMHNRTRMVTASFLVKNLHIDWRRGEAFFARYLIDYDPSVNNGNWQWAASTGCDAQPWFRIFNPWRQQARFDPDAVYIKRWIPELADWDARRIHGLEKSPEGYLAPIVDLKRSGQAIKDAFSKAARKK